MEYICTMAESFSSPIADFYKDRSVLITGVTGFLGKVLVEKLLRSCSKIKTIYVLIRPKRGKEAKQRLEEIFKTQVFERVLKEQPGCIFKLVPIHGDLSLPGLGISESDQELLISNVSIVFHSAASVKIAEPLKQSITMNVIGTQSVIELCHKMVHLEALIHVSTAFCQFHRGKVDEVVYDDDVPVSPKKIIDTIQWMEEETVNLITPHLLKDRPNTYTYTKALAESLLLEESGSLPIGIVRPSIITTSWKEPVPGWVEGFNGPFGFVAPSSKGLLTYVQLIPTVTADLIPVDVVINLMITVAWSTATHKPGKLMVYNCCSSNINRLIWGDFVKLCCQFIQRYPNREVLFYPTYKFSESRLLYQLRSLIYHFLPAYILDLVAVITGRKRQMVPMQRKIYKLQETLDCFINRDCSNSYHNVPILLEKLTPEDKQVFNFDIKTLNWSTYLEDLVLGTRRFLLKDDPSTIPLARKTLKRKYIYTKAAQIILLLLLWKLVVMVL